MKRIIPLLLIPLLLLCSCKKDVQPEGELTVVFADVGKADFILVTNKQLDHFDDYAIHVLTDKYTELIIPKDIWYQMRIGNVMENNMYMNIGQKSVIYCVPAYNISKKNAKRHPKEDGTDTFSISTDSEYILPAIRNISRR